MKKWQSISEDTEANLANAADGNKAPFLPSLKGESTFVLRHLTESSYASAKGLSQLHRAVVRKPFEQ